MWTEVEKAVEELDPVLEAYSLTAQVVDVLDGVVTLRVEPMEGSSVHVPDNLPDLLQRTLQSEVEGVTEVVVEKPAQPAPARGVTIRIDEPAAEETTVVLTLDRVVVPGGSLVFNGAHEAESWPVVQELFTVPHVAMVMARESRLLVSRDGGSWEEILPALTERITAHYGGRRAADPGEPIDEESVRIRVEKLLEDEVNPAVAAHGGYINLLDVQGSTIYVHMGGGCQGCGMASVTLRQGVERLIKEAIPEVSRILDTTDHAAGNNPYYQPQA